MDLHSLINLKDENNRLQFIDNNKERLSGKIVFRKHSYGFILGENGETLFFHSSYLNQDSKRPRLLDHVSYIVRERQDDHRYSARSPYDIIKIADGRPSDYPRFVGIIRRWNNLNGEIFRTKEDGKILFNLNRMLNKQDVFKVNDLVIFHPAENIKKLNGKFAFFMYHLSAERDFELLVDEYRKTQIPELKTSILDSIGKWITDDHKKFKLELELVKDIHQKITEDDLIVVLEKYKVFNFNKLNLIKDYCQEVFLLQILIEGLITEYEYESLKHYFINAPNVSKKEIIKYFSPEDREKVLFEYGCFLNDRGYFSRINEKIETLLHLISKNHAKDKELYSLITSSLFEKITPLERVILWRKNCIQKPDNELIINVLNLNDKDMLEFLIKKEPSLNAYIKKQFEHYFMNVNRSNFGKEMPNLIHRATIFRELFNEKINKTINTLVLDDEQKFELIIFGIPLSGFDAEQFYRLNHQQINPYYKIRYQTLIKDLNNDLVSQDELLKYVETVDWGTLIHPTETALKKHCAHFLPDLEYYFKEVKPDSSKEILSELAVKIYRSFHQVTVHNVRLWLNGYVPENYYNYFNYRKPFKELTNVEKIKFRHKFSLKLYKDVVEQSDIHEVYPCQRVINNLQTGIKEHTATVENIYFNRGSWILRMEDGNYTDEFKDELAFPGLNRLDLRAEIGEVELKILTKGKKVISSNGFEKIYRIIIRLKIEVEYIPEENSLEEPDNPGDNVPYVEDYELRKKIVSHLETLQFPDNHILKIEEKVFVSEHLGIEGYDEKDCKTELVGLFTIKTEDGYGIVVENLDFNDSRATHVFNCRKEKIDQKIRLITIFISGKGWRNTVITSNIDPNSEIKDICDSLGYQGSIRKRRGSINEFDKWKHDLDYLIHKPYKEFDKTDVDIETLLKKRLKRGRNYGQWDGRVSKPKWGNSAPGINEKSDVIKISEEQITKVDIDYEDEKEKSGEQNALSELLKNIKIINTLIGESK